MTVLAIPKAAACPVCQRAPYVERCEPWPRGHGPAPWAVGCYALAPFEHFVGVNGADQLDAIRQWNAESELVLAGDFDTPRR